MPALTRTAAVGLVCIARGGRGTVAGAWDHKAVCSGILELDMA